MAIIVVEVVVVDMDQDKPITSAATTVEKWVTMRGTVGQTDGLMHSNKALELPQLHSNTTLKVLPLLITRKTSGDRVTRPDTGLTHSAGE